MKPNLISRRESMARAAAAAAGLGLAVSMVTASRRAKAEVDPPPDPEADNVILNALLSAEYDAVATYSAGAGIIGGDVTTPQATRDVVTDVAVHFRDQHSEHAVALAALITENGGTPVADQGMPSIPASFPLATATTTDVMKLAADKEKQASFTYADVMKAISTQTAAKLVAAIGGVETQHFVVLYLLVEGLAAATEGTAMNPTLVVPAAFVADGYGSSIETSAALDAALALDPPA